MKRSRRGNGSGSLFKRAGKGCWIASWYDHNGKRCSKSTKTTDRAAAERILTKITGDTALRREGVIDVRSEAIAREQRRPVTKHLAEWIADTQATGVSLKHVTLLKTRVEKLLRTMNAQLITDLNPADVQAALARMTKAAHPIGRQTRQHYIRAAKQFSRWLDRNRRSQGDALVHLACQTTPPGLQYARRPLTEDELAWLLKSTEQAPAWRGIAGVDRAMLYRVATGTGFRAAELRSLKVSSFDLDASPPAVTVEAAYSKRRREDRQPIRTDLAECLRLYLRGRRRNAPALIVHERTAAMLKHDLRRARARWITQPTDRRIRRERRQSSFLSPVDSEGKIVDFHALRTTYITLLVKGGAPVKVAQELARHSDPKLTLNIYTKLGIHDLTGALNVLPPTSPPRSMPESGESSAQQPTQQRARE